MFSDDTINHNSTTTRGDLETRHSFPGQHGQLLTSSLAAAVSILTETKVSVAWLMQNLIFYRNYFRILFTMALIRLILMWLVPPKASLLKAQVKFSFYQIRKRTFCPQTGSQSWFFGSICKRATYDPLVKFLNLPREQKNPWLTTFVKLCDLGNDKRPYKGSEEAAETI